MRIVIDPFDKKSIDAALKMVRQYKKDFEAKEQEFVRRLAEIGVRVAQAGYAVADYDGENDVVVGMEETSNGYTVVASGETVGFIEFGTGVKFPEWDNTGMEYTPPAHGTYGKGQGKNPWGWYFSSIHDGAASVHTFGNPPAEAMLTARNEMIERVTQIAREVWR
jgi:hypothetical protein